MAHANARQWLNAARRPGRCNNPAHVDPLTSSRPDCTVLGNALSRNAGGTGLPPDVTGARGY
ncbi:hypothetical protein GCM10009662_12060 [Catellatospora coxensis]|uniref:Uncharacterized protein n=1 Tax=Catellatospora coxensis TaxID=310354 RepID=A0A8J3KXX5_9ACTN|nr:hypothetical protein Cco03nite_48730 [Catellatospora coxensis]